MQLRKVRVLALAIAAFCAGVMPAAAQITTGTVTGTVKDAQGGVIPGATVVLVSEARGTKLAPVVTNETGDFVIPNVTADVYTVEVTMDSFKTVRRQNIRVSGGDRVGVPPITLETGAIAETVNVSAEAMLVQSQSAERSFAIDQVQIENLPINRGNFTSLTAFTPGVVAGGASAGGTRLGGAGQNNIMMDGISAMDTGNNGQMLNMNIESIGEVKILTQGYQAEYGRSSGLQITAVTKSGTNRFRGSGYTILTDSDWNTNSWVNQRNGDAKPENETKTYGYSVGGPVGKPGGNNKLFFFYAHEYRPTNNAINNGNPIRLKVPTQAERNGDFSQTVDNTGAAFAIRDYQSNANFPGGVIPQDRLYGPGLALLRRYPLPNRAQTPGTNYNYELAPPAVKDLQQQPAVRIDYQLSSKLRFTGKYSGERSRPLVRPGTLPGFSDAFTPYPFITNYAFTANYTLSPTTFIEATYGMIRNELAGGNENGIVVNEEANRLTSLGDFPLIYPNAGLVNPDYYAYQVLEDTSPAFWDGTKMNLPPLFNWGSRVVGGGGTCGQPGPPCQRYPGWLNINRTQDVAVSLTKVMGRHTIKGGFYNNHSFKAQNTGVGFQGTVSFANDTNNLLDTGYGYANAALGVFTQYTQSRDFIEGSMIYNNTEFYIQDNWKASNRLTLDYGVRFTRQQPQYDQFQQMSNFFPEQWTKANAPILYVSGTLNGVRNAMDPRTGQILTAPGAANTAAAIGTPIPGTGNPLNGIRQAGDGIAKTGYTWPTLVIGPRFGVAYDLTGDQTTVLRGGGGLFYDRPDGNTVFGIPNNPPITTTADLRNGQLSTLGQGLSFQPVPGLQTFQYDADVPAQWHWQAGVQRSLPFAMVADVSYVGNHGWNRLAAFQNGSPVNLNAIDIGTAFLPQYQDPTLSSSVPGGAAYTTNLLRPFQGLGNINQQTTEFWDTYHSLQTSVNRRFRNGFSFGANYTWGISLTGNTGLQKRLQHNADGSISVRADQAAYEELNKNLDRRPHYLKANTVWDLPNVNSLGTIVNAILNDWQVAGVLTMGSGAAYDLNYSFNANGGNVNMTGSPDYGARIVYVGDPGGGCSDNQYNQFNVSAVTAPSYGSVGLESGRNIMRGCMDKTVDLSISRDIRVGGNRRLELRVDAFNAFNTVVYNGRSNTIQFNSPTDLTVRNPQYLADGQLDPTRLTPRNAGFGAATGAQAMRSIQVYARFAF